MQEVFQEIFVESSLDHTMQPSLFLPAKGEGKRPLLVGLHTWSADRFNQVEKMPPLARKRDFHLLLPEFRGPNLVDNPKGTEACGSVLAKQDIVDAIQYVIANREVDPEQIFLLGASGGGHMALMMAGYAPELFQAIGAFVPICNLEDWAEENASYRPHILSCCSNDPEEMKARSPISYLDKIAEANLKIFHGKYDPLVPVSQSLKLYAKLFEKHPRCRVFLDIFDGGHEIDYEAALYWLFSQYEEKEKGSVTG